MGRAVLPIACSRTRLVPARAAVRSALVIPTSWRTDATARQGWCEVSTHLLAAPGTSATARCGVVVRPARSAANESGVDDAADTRRSAVLLGGLRTSRTGGRSLEDCRLPTNGGSGEQWHCRVDGAYRVSRTRDAPGTVPRCSAQGTTAGSLAGGSADATAHVRPLVSTFAVAVGCPGDSREAAQDVIEELDRVLGDRILWVRIESGQAAGTCQPNDIHPGGRHLTAARAGAGNPPIHIVTRALSRRGPAAAPRRG